MSIKEKFKHKKVKSLENALSIVIKFNRIFGVRSFEFPKGHLRPLLSVFYVSIFYCAYTAFIYFGPIKGTGNLRVRLANYVSSFTGCLNLLVVVVYSIFGIYYTRLFKECLGRISLVDKSLELLGSPTNYEKLRVTCILSLIGWYLWMGFMFFITIKWQLDRRDIYSAIFITLTYNHSMDIGGLVAITFALIVSLMKERFRRINQFLKCLEYPSNYKGTGSSLFDSLVPSYIVVQPWKDSRFRLLGIVKQSHLELCKTSRDLTKSFGIQMSIETARTVIVFTALCFQLYNKVKSFNATFSSRLNDTLVTALLCVSHVFKIFLVNLTCTLTKREGQQTAEILHRVNSLDMDYEMKEEIHQFSLQMTQIPLEFSAYGFFCLDCSFLCGVFSTVATYLMILIQMGDQDGTNKITHK